MMSRPVVWFLAGVLATVLVLVLGGVVISATQFGDDSVAQGTWQLQLLLDSTLHREEDPSMPELYIDDWVRTLPDNCDFVQLDVPVGYALAYRCPE
jgi:hypothetical protein